MLQCKVHVSRLPFLPIRVRGIFSYPIGKKWLTYISMYHQLSNSGYKKVKQNAIDAGMVRDREGIEERTRLRQVEWDVEDSKKPPSETEPPETEK